jgi:hypothetical protein
MVFMGRGSVKVLYYNQSNIFPLICFCPMILICAEVLVVNKLLVQVSDNA